MSVKIVAKIGFIYIIIVSKRHNYMSPGMFDNSCLI